MPKQYSAIAPIYNYLMRSIDYIGWAEYVYSIYELAGSPKGDVLELGSGTGKISKHLANRFNNIILTDLSFEMLNYDDKNNLNCVVCNMTELPFKKIFSYIYSSFDSINYILSSTEMEIFFNTIANVLDNKGCFTFDVSLENNSLRYQESLNRTGSLNGIKFEQKSYYLPSERIHYNEFIIDSGTEIFKETHKQKIYKFFDYFEMLESSKLYVENCFDAFTYKDAHNNSERVQFILKKKY